ncbi:5-amino-6-(D-ribitylamino)uracil--L-tyrosine 4-hydroxyphenyl transferase CofH [Pseudorhodoplanes sp.]|uniref:5-amino-6-(D-ribitylamino)uracil--L-tyrosine 4-hydroxyphenyl transferase CofH n=1 Tax=Pseudorhodoplanes sp. TaxID=1934341 RepID=UPI003D11FE75
MIGISSDHLKSLVAAPSASLQAEAAQLRDQAFGRIVTYSPKVFIPLTVLCRNVCAYCTFAKAPSKATSIFLAPEDVLQIANAGKANGCFEALFTLGDRPELRYSAAADWLKQHGYDSTSHYLAAMAKLVFDETGLFPHINAGALSHSELKTLREVSFSQGMMLESISVRLCERGGPHFGSPDKTPSVRLEVLKAAGELQIPFTTGLLIGIGETRQERIEAMIAIRDLHNRYEHIQEIIVQNFRAKPGTRMAGAAEPEIEEVLWTTSVARLIFGPDMSIQVPPNLNANAIDKLIDAGINDWGGISPVTPDHVNPEAAWPHVADLAAKTAESGKVLQPRLTLYPRYTQQPNRWLHQQLHRALKEQSDSEGYARTDQWSPGSQFSIEHRSRDNVADLQNVGRTSGIERVIMRARSCEDLSESEIVELFAARGPDFETVCMAADSERRRFNGDTVTYVVTRNINYTNICGYRCSFCAFSKGKIADHLRGRPYLLDLNEISRRSVEAWDRGATEVCLQGGIHPSFTGDTYIEICRAIKDAVPAIHIHAFSPLEIYHGATTLGVSVSAFLTRLKAVGLSSLPGTAAEILDDEVRRVICPDKLSTAEWLSVIESAHNVGLRTTATIMFGHVDRPVHWARHLLHLRRLQQRTAGFTEFVPLPFVPMEAPIYLRGGSRRGPTSREAILMHAVSRLVLAPHFVNIQTSWAKMGRNGAVASLSAGCNDMGGTLMNESISRAAGAANGQELTPHEMDELISKAQRVPLQRNTLYGRADKGRVMASHAAPQLSAG